jgi:3-methyladenine DNA glycosylase AlkD
MTHPLVRAVRARLKAAADPDRAIQMRAYMKSSMPFLGVDAPRQRAIWRDVFRAWPLSSAREWKSVVLTLWRDARYREERYAAVALLGHRAYLEFRTRAALPMIEEMIVTGAWWDLVDVLAIHDLGDVLQSERRAGRSASMRRHLLTWARSDNVWKRRSAILVQVGFKQDTDLDLLYACIAPSLLEPADPASAAGLRRGPQRPKKTGSRGNGDIRHDFFIRKAIGWALRQHARVAPLEVERYVRAHASQLSPLSVREALKHL